jgi:WD40 repeat protein
MRAHRRALVVGIPTTGTELGEERPAGQLPDLPYATAAAGDLEAALKLFGYPGRSPAARPRKDPSRSAAALDRAVRDTVRAGSGVAVIHVLGHGVITDEGSGSLYVVGGDGRRPDTDVEGWLKLVEDHDRNPTTLFVIDTCYSGRATAFPWQQLTSVERQRAWVIAACAPDAPAFDGRLTRAMAQVLRRFHDGTLRIDPAMPYIPLDIVCREIERVMAELTGKDGFAQTLVTSRIPLHADADGLPFFPNPRHRAPDAVRREVDPALTSLLDEALDARHFTSRAGGWTSDPSEVGLGFFHGRERELRTLSAWMDDGTDPALRLVTGKPGVGKSALLGVLVCAAHPVLRDLTASLWNRLPAVPSRNRTLLVVHARGRGVDEIAAALARQCQAELPTGPVEATDLLRIFARRPAPPLIVLDALDEALRPEDVVHSLLLPLVRAAPVCRLLIGTRPAPGIHSLMDLGTVLDLGETPREELRGALAAYATDLLRGHDRYEDAGTSRIRRELADAMASRLARSDTRDGEFLMAGLWARELLSGPSAAPTREALTQVPDDLGEMLSRGLGGQGRSPWERPVLMTLAHAEGAGMPERVLRRAVEAFTSDGLVPSLDELRTALDAAAFYVRQETDDDGSPLYHLSHQGLADRLFDGSRSVALFDALLAAAGPWRTADPYLLRHAPAHAVRAGKLDELLADADFLCHAGAAPLSRVLVHARTDAGRRTAAIYRASYRVHHALPPDERRMMLALDACRYGDRELAARLSGNSGWRPRWATGGQLGQSLLHTLSGHGTSAIALAPVRIDGRTMAVTTSNDMSARLWDLHTCRTVAVLTGHTERIAAVACAHVNGRPLAVTASDDGTARVWDLTKGRTVHVLRGHRGRVSSVVCTEIAGRGVAITAGSDDGCARVWDLASGEPTGVLFAHEPSEPAHPEDYVSLLHKSVSSVDCAVLEGRPVLVTSGFDGTARVWDLATHRKLRVLHCPYEIYGVSCTTVEGRPVVVAASRHSEVFVWDMSTAELLHVLSGHTGVANSVRCFDMDGSPYAVSTSWDETARVWSLSTGELIAVLTGHAESVNGADFVMLDRHPVALTVSTDATLRVWDLAQPQHEVPLPGACTRMTSAGGWGAADGRPVVVTGDIEGTLTVRDAATGDVVSDFTGHEGGIIASLACTELDGVGAALSGGSDGTLRLWDLATGSEMLCVNELPGTTSGLAWTRVADRPVAVAANELGYAISLDMEAMSSLELYARHTGYVNDVACAHLRGRPMAVTVSRDETARIWDAVTGRTHRVLRGHTRPVIAVATTALDGKPAAVTVSYDATARVWDLATGRCLRVYADHDETMSSVACTTAGGRALVATAGDQTVRVWDPATGVTLTALPFPSSVRFVSFGPNGELAVGFGWDIAVLDPAALGNRA